MNIDWLASQRRSALALACGLGFALLVVTGCSKEQKLARLEGRVTFKGEPVKGGPMIVFRDADRGIHITSKLGENGEYRVEMAEGYGLPPGEYQVAIVPPPILMSPEFLEKHREGPPHLAAYPSIPLRYRTTDTSNLRLRLPPEGTVFDVDMQP